MEKIPGFETAATTFPSYILSITKFAIWTVGIAALLMITIGGFMYMTSAGNTSRMESAKKVIFDALFGLLIALAAWLLLYVINPDLVKINLTLKAVELPKPAPPARPPGVYPPPVRCAPLSTGPCSVENLRNTCFASVAEQASGICNAESGGIERRASGVDRCQPGNEVVSWGLFQINISANPVAGLNCPSAFSNPYTGRNHNCTVTNQTLYQQCVAAAQTASTNIQAACSIYQSSGWRAWGANSVCNF
ncbi:MAG: hypothetical protein NT136_00320 [Candidatus Moranbacteria bacterium]|nr:hypothetical protein [Candidatus Moranbacteria bacterium]